MKIQYIERIVNIQMYEQGKQVSIPVDAIEGIDTGLCITPLNGDSTRGYVLTHTRTGYILPNLGVEIAPTIDVAKMWLEKVHKLLDWNMPVDKMKDACEQQYGSRKEFLFKLNDAFDEACEKVKTT